jgi:hypothetical protein
MSLTSDIPDKVEVKEVIEKKIVEKKVIQKADMNDKKYIVLLKLLNAILANIGKDPITEITQFVDISRIDIVKKENVETLKAMEDELFPLYNKVKCGYYRQTDGLVHNCLRGMIKQIGYEFSFKKKDVYITVEGKNFRKTDNIYTIK